MKENAWPGGSGKCLQLLSESKVMKEVGGGVLNVASRETAIVKGKAEAREGIMGFEPSETPYDGIVGNSPALKRIMENASIVAKTACTVLITGETGTGKELLARAIHGMSGRKHRSFAKVNCAAIPFDLLESELFGHEKGAFTGAVNQKVGRLEVADKGTLFLDEIGEIPLGLQPKLLRVLQDSEFERLGGSRTIRVDVRLIAATNVNLPRAVQEKRFRSDLFYQLHVFPLHMPALRDRPEDIPRLVRHFVNKFAREMQKHIDVIPEEAMESFLSWDWPGNIRELENFIERSVISSSTNILSAPYGRSCASSARISSSRFCLTRGRIIEVLRECGGLIFGRITRAERPCRRPTRTRPWSAFSMVAVIVPKLSIYPPPRNSPFSCGVCRCQCDVAVVFNPLLFSDRFASAPVQAVGKMNGVHLCSQVRHLELGSAVRFHRIFLNCVGGFFPNF